jgi:hypothetical protein
MPKMTRAWTPVDGLMFAPCSQALSADLATSRFKGRARRAFFPR